MSLKCLLLLASLGSLGFGQNLSPRSRMTKYYVSHRNDALVHLPALLECMLHGMSPITVNDLNDHSLMAALEPQFHNYAEDSIPEFWVTKDSMENVQQFMRDLITLGGYMTDDSAIILNNERYTYVCYKLKLTPWGVKVLETACSQKLPYVCKRYAYRPQRQDRSIALRSEFEKEVEEELENPFHKTAKYSRI